MKITSVALALALIAQIGFCAAPASDSTIEFENPWVRIVRVHYAAHVKTAVHDHPPTPTVYIYSTDGGRLRLGHDGEEPVTRPPVKQNGIRFQKGVFERHWVEELDGVNSEYIRVELKTRQVELPDVDVRRAPGDATPYESAFVRIDRVTCPAKSTCPASTHPENPAVVVAGNVAKWVPPNSAPIRNDSDAPLEQVRIELKTEPIASK